MSTSASGAQGDIPRSKERPASRRRQWGGQSRSSSGVISISTDSLEKLVPTLTVETKDVPVLRTGPQSDSENAQAAPMDSKIVESDNGQVELEVEAIVDNMDTEDNHVESESSKQTKSPTKPSVEEHRSPRAEVLSPTRAPDDTGSNKSSPRQDSSAKPPSPPKRKGPKETKAVGYLVEAPERIEPSQPAKHKPTDIVYIRSLVRPFTVEQLRQMISDHFGPVAEIWLDRIKSSSLVRMESMEAAEKCREGLDGSRWPSMNPRVLRCDFGNEALFDWMKANGASGDLAPPRHLVLGQPEGVADDPPTTDGRTSKGDRSNKRGSGSQDLRNRLDADARGKDSSPRRKSPVPKEAPDPKKKREEPAKLLDDLFRKTESAPRIYWLPLTEEEAKKQAEERLCVFAAKRSAYTRATRPTQRATRSPFTSPGPSEAAMQKPTERPSQTSSTSKPAQPERSEPVPDSKDSSTKEVPVEPKSRTQQTDAGDRSRKKSPTSSAQDVQSDKRDKRPVETRRRERSPFTPEKMQSSTEQRSTTDKPTRPSTASTSANKRPRSRSPTPRRSQPSKADRRRRSSSRSSTSRGGSRRRTTGSSSRRDRRSPPSSSKYTRPRSRSVERRAISPPTHRSYGRSHR